MISFSDFLCGLRGVGTVGREYVGPPGWGWERNGLRYLIGPVEGGQMCHFGG